MGFRMIPADIDNAAQFGTRLRGYDVNAVDDFLDRVRDAWRRDRAELEERDRHVAHVERQLRIRTEENLASTAQMPSFAIDATRILEAAQRTADDVIAEARSQAFGITDEASVKAQKILDDANSEAGIATDEARRYCETARADAMGQVNAWQARVTELQAQEMKLREFVTGALEAAKERLDR